VTTEPTNSVTALREVSFSRWERGFEKVVVWVPYVTLGLGTSLSLMAPGQTWGERMLTLVLSAATAAWVLVMFSLAGERRTNQAWMRVYLFGVILIAAGLMIYDTSFFVFAITGFIQAYVLRPVLVGFIAVALTSLVINSGIVYPEPTTEGWWMYWIVVSIQTTAIGFGVMGGEKISELSENRRRAVLELEALVEENAGLHAQLVTQAREAGVTDERQRMAREIHDTIAQGLTGVITQLEAAGQVKGDPDAVQRRIDNATRLARESLTEARRSVSANLPTHLEDRGLWDALEDVTSNWSSMSQVPAELTTTGEAQSLHPEVEVTLLRVTQEALANIAKHAGASRVGVTLSYMGDVVTVDVRDDGVGFSSGNQVNGSGSMTGYGLTAMRQRVEGLSGILVVETAPGVGTAISATIPAIPQSSTT
jgi:signal transduction histidine kinase